MLKHRLIPVLLIADGKVIQSVQFKHTNIIHWKPVTAVDFFDHWAADEIVVLDVSRTKTGRETFYEVVSQLSKKCFVPLSVGGWVDAVEEVRKLLRLGADKVTINTQAFRTPSLISDCAKVFGSQCIVISIDAKLDAQGHNKVCIDRGREMTDVEPIDWARQVEALGAGEIFINSVDRDGFRRGYDITLIQALTQAVQIPVIAMGGVFTWQHLVEGVTMGGADAVAAANIFHYTELSTKKAKQFMREAGLAVR